MNNYRGNFTSVWEATASTPAASYTRLDTGQRPKLPSSMAAFAGYQLLPISRKLVTPCACSEPARSGTARVAAMAGR